MVCHLTEVADGVKPYQSVVEVTRPGMPKRRGAYRATEVGPIVVPEPID